MKRILAGFAGVLALAGCSGAIDPVTTGTGTGASTGEGTETAAPPATPSTPAPPPAADPPASPPATPPAAPPTEPPVAPAPPADPPADPPPSGVTCTATTTSYTTLGVNICDYSVPPTESTTTENDVTVRRYTSPPAPKLCISSSAVSRYTNSGTGPVCLWGPAGGKADYVGTITVSADGTTASVNLSGSRSVAGPCRIFSIKCWGSTTIK